jgi:hypothetical protein
MTSLTREVDAIQNPAFGAVVLWRFCHGYSETSAHGSVPFLGTFIPLPILLREDALTFVVGTKGSSSLRAFADKFGLSKIRKTTFCSVYKMT